MIICDYCKKVIPPGQHSCEQGRDLHTRCLRFTTVNWIIMDYVEVCNRRGQLLSFNEFFELWMAANEIAVEEVQSPPEEDPPPPLPFAPRSRR